MLSLIQYESKPTQAQYDQSVIELPIGTKLNVLKNELGITLSNIQ